MKAFFSKLSNELTAKAMIKGGSLLKAKPEIKTKTDVEGSLSELKEICELLKGNAIPTTSFNAGRELII